MNYEQKYKEALDRARKIENREPINVPDGTSIPVAIFPELKESEDEKIRKELIRAFKSMNSIKVWNGIERTNILAWLEKQGEQKQEANYPKFEFNDILALQCCMETVKKVQGDKELYGQLQSLHNRLYDAYQLEKQNDNADKVEPNFKVGDWIVFNGLTLYINEVVKGYYRTISKGGIPNSYDWDIDAIARLWTIENAKDGDVLCVKYGNNEMPFIFTGKQKYVAYCSLNSFGEFVLSMADWLLKTSVSPATKEQRDLLFQKMQESGYGWDDNKKELIKL